MARVYALQFGLRLTGLRYFTVYGPWGRPDMAPVKFARALLQDRPIEVYGHGDMQRDFTYIDDIVAGTLAALDDLAHFGQVPHRLYNLGHGHPEALLDFIEVLARVAGRPIKPKSRKLICEAHIMKTQRHDEAGAALEPLELTPEQMAQVAGGFLSAMRDVVLAATASDPSESLTLNYGRIQY
jgi:nucleoside-diphosphate-sugar epimerase